MGPTCKEVWVVGALGRSAREVVAALGARGVPLVLIGRNAAALQELVERKGGASARYLVADSIEAMGRLIADEAAHRPLVVFNAIGPFAQTAVLIIRACAPRGDYLDLSNELPGITGVLALHEEAAREERCLVAGAGWGVLACESAALTVCAGHPPPAEIRVDSVPHVNSPPGPVGHTLASTIIESFPYGVRMYRGGQLVRVGVGDHPEELTLPDGSKVKTGNAGLGDLAAAQRASGAPTALAASCMVPTGAVARTLMPLVMGLLSFRAVRQVAVQQVAKMQVHEKPPVEKSSWARAKVTWADGAVRSGWLKVGDAGVFTANVAAEVAYRLACGEGRPGAFTPGALFGAELAVTAGGEFVMG